MKPIDSHRWSCCWSGCAQVSTMVLDDKTLPKRVEIDEDTNIVKSQACMVANLFNCSNLFHDSFGLRQ